MYSVFSKLLYLCFVVPLKTQATINPANVLNDEYADITSDPAQQMIDSIIPEVRIIFHTLLYHETMHQQENYVKQYHSANLCWGLGFDSQHWSCVNMLGNLRIPRGLRPPSCNGYLVHKSKVGSIIAGCMGIHLTRGKVGPLSIRGHESLDCKQLPLHILPLLLLCTFDFFSFFL